MVIVTGSIVARPETIDELLGLCLEHVRRSRMEPGCQAHAVHRDAENPLRLVFLEEWDGRAALAAHFAVPARNLAAGAPTLNVFEATPTDISI